jgi:hypothetical protein
MKHPTPAPTKHPVLSVDKRLARLTDAKAALDDALDGFAARIAKINPADHAFPQAANEAKLVLDQISESVEAATKAYKDAVIGHSELGGEFEHGRIAVQVTESLRTTPKWQDEALTLAKALDAAAGIPFDEKRFIETVKAKYSPTVSKTVKLSVSL